MDLESGARRVEGAEAVVRSREAAVRLAQSAERQLSIVETLPQTTVRIPTSQRNKQALSRRSCQKRKWK